MRRFDLYHCLGDQLCARILQLTKTVARAERANRARRLGMPKGTLSRQLQKASFTVNKHCSWAFFHLCLWLRGLPGNHASSSSSLNLHAVILGPHYTHCWSRLRSFLQPPEVLTASQSCWGYHFSLTALVLLGFNRSWQIKSLSINYPSTYWSQDEADRRQVGFRM